MKFNIRPTDCKYIINKDERKVVCILENTSSLFTTFIVENLSLPMRAFYDGRASVNKLFEHLKMPNRFIGIATCSDEDEFDEELGKMIAFSRLKNKVNESFFKRAMLFVDTYDRWLDEATDIFNNLGYKLTVNMNKREELIADRLGQKEKEEA